MNFISQSDVETKKLGEKYGSALKGGEVFLLIGDLGGGKTHFTKGLATGLGVAEPVTSPTFNFENIYQGKKLSLYHFDLYRNGEVDEDIGFLIKEAISDKDGVVVIEWAERARSYWPSRYTLIKFNWISDQERMISVIKK